VPPTLPPEEGVPPLSATCTFAIVLESAPKDWRSETIAFIWVCESPDCACAGVAAKAPAIRAPATATPARSAIKRVELLVIVITNIEPIIY
jgi:hypothetical protein